MIETAVFDLETTALEGDRGIILCACIQSSKAKKMITYRTDDLNAGWVKGQRGDDSVITAKVAKLLAEHDVLAAHNGTRFDIPFLRTRLLKWGMKRLPDIKVVDPLQIFWRKMRMHRNSLGAISDILGLKERKTPLDLSVWADAMMNGTRNSMDLIVTHCQKDVTVLHGVFEAVKDYIKVLDDRGSAL